MAKDYFQGLSTDEYEEMRKPEAKDWRERMRNAATFWLCVAIVCGVLALAGCATAPVPECDEVEAALINSPRGPLLVFDMNGIAQLQARQLDLQDGKCRLPAPGEKV